MLILVGNDLPDLKKNINHQSIPPFYPFSALPYKKGFSFAFECGNNYIDHFCVQWTIQTLKPQPQPQYQYPDQHLKHQGGYTRSFTREFDMIYGKKCYYDARFLFSLTTLTFSPRFYHPTSISASLTRLSNVLRQIQRFAVPGQHSQCEERTQDHTDGIANPVPMQTGHPILISSLLRSKQKNPLCLE